MLPWLALCGALAAQEPAGDAAAFQALGLDSPKLLEAPAGPPLAGAELERRTLEVTSLMRCPVCQGLSIADSPTESAQAMKQEVREMLAAGYSREQVLGYFERSYGEFIRLSPKPTGFNLLVWLLPILGILAGALLIAARLRSTRPVVRDTAATPEPELDPYLERVRKEAGS